MPKRNVQAIADKAAASLRPVPAARGFAGMLGPARLENAVRIPRDQVVPNPDQPRRLADPERLAELAADIAQRGILEPLLVRPTGDGRYAVIAGGRRLAAAEIAQLAEIPCLVRDDLTDEEARTIALVENLQREDLDPEDEGRAFKALQDQGWSLRQIAGAIHKSPPYVMRRLRLIDDPAALAAWRDGLLNLNELLEADSAPPVATLAAAAQAAADQLAQGEPGVSPGNTLGSAGDTVSPGNTPSAVFDEARSRRASLLYKPLNKVALNMQRLPPTAVPEAERPQLKRQIGDLIDALTAYYQELEEAE